MKYLNNPINKKNGARIKKKTKALTTAGGVGCVGMSIPNTDCILTTTVAYYRNGLRTLYWVKNTLFACM